MSAMDDSPHLAEKGEVPQEHPKEEASAIAYKEKEPPRSESRKTWVRLVLVIILLFIALCTFMGLYFVELSRNHQENTTGSIARNPGDDGDSPAPSPMTSPPSGRTDTIDDPDNPFLGSPKRSRLYSALSPVASPTFYMANETQNPIRSEYMAWKWLSEEDFSSDTLADSTPDWKIIERYALAVFYYDTNGEGWTNQYKFLSNESVCDWRGISSFHFGVRFCSDDGSVTMLQLPSNNLEGNLPTVLGLLSNLSSLDLPDNLLDGSLPTEIFRLSNLSGRFDLSHNQLSGSMPSGVGRLSNLAELLLQYNRLEGEIPNEILDMTSLTSMNLGSNLLEGSIPSNLGSSLPLLQDLRLDDNNLTGKLPPSIGSLSRLHKLHLQQNNLSGDIPASIANLENDDAHSFNLYLHANNFTTGASMELLCQDGAVCQTRMGCTSDCDVACSCCQRCYAPEVTMCAKVSPSLNGCRMIMDDNLNQISSVLQAINPVPDPNVFFGFDRDFPFVVTDKINIDSEDSAYSVNGWVAVNGGPMIYSPKLGVPDVTCQELMTNDWYAMRDDSQLRFMEVPGYPCTEFGKRIIYRLIMEWLYFG